MVGTIKYICIFIVCAQMIMHFKPAQKYEKYMKLLIGIMVLVQLFLPLMTLIYPNSEAELEDKILRYENEIFGVIEGKTKTYLPDEENISQMQMKEIKSIYNNIKQDKADEGSVEETQKSIYEDEEVTDAIKVERIEVTHSE